MTKTAQKLIEELEKLPDNQQEERAASYLEDLQQRREAEVVPLTEELFQRGFTLYQQRQDKSWGLTDCISFVVMRERGTRDALSTDSDFEQAGFNALPRE